MSTTTIPAPRDVATTLNYFKLLGEGPPRQYLHLTADALPKSNVALESQPAIVHDVRGREAEFTLDIQGLQFIHFPSAETDFVDDEIIKTKYYAEVESLLKRETGAKRVHIFDHIIRRSADPKDQRPGLHGPAEGVHIDQAYEASIQRVKDHLPEDADRLLESRVRIINVWRPIQNPVAHKPLGVADWGTLDPKDLVPIELVYPHRTGTTFGVAYNPGLKWYFLADQTADEVTLLKIYDSREDVARLTPHSAFLDATSPKDAPQRQSIEVRALVFDGE
ncbi:hypothetical protein K466DRAFT_483666 [Polyporus arcularius HHB13444]|uniref:Methyltransferase n=1 Tax=Polyporus arcularius HHB13444 TaxID=1314778 RepID=A0A5C3PRJ0_9APHY|nr:hypothetical protein K466DRAFT_483666 [Polyporus arcularius HHB13444]